MNSWFLATGRIYFKRKVFKSFKVQISSFKVRILAFKVQTFSAIPLRSPEPSLNSHVNTIPDPPWWPHIARYCDSIAAIPPIARYFLSHPSNPPTGCDTPLGCLVLHLVAPYCAIPRDYLSDTPLLRTMGFLVSQHGQLGAIPPPPFLSISPLESMQSGGAIPPLKRGISAIPARYPMKTRQMGAIPPSAILSRKGIARYGGVSRTGPLSLHRHISAIPHFATYRAILGRYPKKTSTKKCCDTIAESIARYEKYRCWAF